MQVMMVFFLAAGLLIASTATSMAGITRSCTSSIRVGNIHGRKELGRIAGQGTCGKLQPNKCRESAHRAINKCIEAIWNHRFENRIPSACNTLASGKTGAKLIWKGNLSIKQPNRITARIAHWACCTKFPNASSVKVVITGAVTGDKGCGTGGPIGKKLYQADWGMPHYNVPCDDWRTKKGICN